MDYNLSFAGSPFNPQLREFLMSIAVKDEIGLLSDTCDLVFSYDARLPDFKIDTVIGVKLGDGHRLWDVGTYYISEVAMTGPPNTLTVRGMSTPLILAKSLQNFNRRAWQRAEASLSQIMRQVVSDAGLLLKYNAIEDPLMPYVQQAAESDSTFLLRLARLHNLRFKVDGRNIVVFDIDAGVDLAKNKIPTVEITEAETTSFSFLDEGRDPYESAKAWLTDIPGSKRDSVVVGSGKPQIELPEQFPTYEEAKAACYAKLAESRRQKYQASVSFPGRPGIIAGGKLALTGFPKIVNREYLIERVTHSFDTSIGYRIRADLVNVAEVPNV